MLYMTCFYLAGWNESTKTEIPETAVDTQHSGDSFTHKVIMKTEKCSCLEAHADCKHHFMVTIRNLCTL